MHSPSHISAHSPASRVASVALALLVAAACFGAAPSPSAAVTTTALRLTVAPSGAARPADYTLSGFRAKNETITRYAVTFPAGTNVSGAQGPNPGDTVSIVGTRITVILAAPIVGGGGGGTAFSAVFRNIGNPVTPGNYNLPSITFTTSTGSTQTINLGKTGNYTILASPYLTLTISTPGASQSVDFGNLDPGQPVTANVLVEIDSSGPWIMTRSTSGNVAELAVAITSPAPIGLATPAGFYAYTEVYTVNPPWTTTPGIPYSVGVVYTVTQQ